MNVKDIAAAKGISLQAVYKRIRARKIDLSSLQDKLTGEFTKEGEQTIRRLFSLDKPIEEDSHVAEEAVQEFTESKEKVSNELIGQLEELKREVERLQTEIANLKQHEEELIGEREYLKGALDRAQQLQAMTISKLPEPVKKLQQPASDTESIGKITLRQALSMWLGSKKGNTDEKK